MPALDVFKADAFSMASLTAAINAVPYQPKMVGEMGLFTPKPITTTVAHVEMREGQLSVLATAPRGDQSQVQSKTKRKVRTFAVPHIPSNRTVLADDVQNVRAFGSETEMQTVAALVNEQLAEARADHETTFEWHRLGALTGAILDSDGSTIYNLFTEFGVSEVTVDFVLGTATTDVREKCTAVKRAVESALGGDSPGAIRAFVGDNFWDDLVSHPLVKEAYQNWSAAVKLSNQPHGDWFEFGGIQFKNYRGNVGGTNWLANNLGRAFPTGVSQLYQHVMAPGDMIDTVNTLGRMMYAKQEVMRFDKGIEIHTQSNPLMLCTRPKVLIKLTSTGTSA